MQLLLAYRRGSAVNKISNSRRADHQEGKENKTIELCSNEATGKFTEMQAETKPEGKSQ